MKKQLMKFGDVAHSRNPRAPHADVTNAPQLFGDIQDFEDGDPDMYGDPDLYGDIDPLAAYIIGSGDIEDEAGDLRTAWNKTKGWIGRNKGVIAATAGLGAGALTAAAILRNRQKKIQANENLKNQVAIRTSLGKLNKKKPFSFFGLKGAKLNSSPIDPQSKFAADTFKVMLDRQSLDTPFYQETAIGNYAAGTWTCTASGIVGRRFAPALFLQFGTNELNASPGTVISISASIPLFDGTTLTIAAQPFILTYEKGYDVRFMIVPWLLVSNKPIPQMGYYNNGNPIVFTVTGIPSASSVNLVIPGSLHPWTVAMRNAVL